MLARLSILVCAALLGAASAREGDERPGAELIRAKVRVLDTPALAPGEAGELSLLLLEDPDPDMPLLVRIEVDEIGLDDNRLSWSSVVDPLAPAPRVRVAFWAPAEPGRYEVEASVDYSVCSDHWCRAKHAEFGWTVLVESAADEG